MRRLVRESCDFLLHLPMLGHVSSLNASVAGSIVLYEALRQRRAAQFGLADS
jgi:23S rRNA (guanosine2251-2'-O)-methyltransferase